MRSTALYRPLALGVTVLVLGCPAKDGDGSSVSMLEDSSHTVTRADSAMAGGERLAIPEEPSPFAVSAAGAAAAMLEDGRDRSRDTSVSPSTLSRATPIPEEPRPVRP